MIDKAAAKKTLGAASGVMMKSDRSPQSMTTINNE